MAWTSPYTWTAGETVTAAKMIAHVRDQFLHIGGTVGFTRTPSATVGIEPSMGYFVGSTYSSGVVRAGSGTVTTGLVAVSFPVAFTAAPVVIAVAKTSNVTQDSINIYAVTTTGFQWARATSSTAAMWLAFGA